MGRMPGDGDTVSPGLGTGLGTALGTRGTRSGTGERGWGQVRTAWMEDGVSPGDKGKSQRGPKEW